MCKDFFRNILLKILQLKFRLSLTSKSRFKKYGVYVIDIILYK